MKKSLIKSVLTGACCGLAANQAACFLASKALRLGYYAACPAWLPEKVGGEMNAVLLQMALFALNGILVSFLVFNKQNMNRPGYRTKSLSERPAPREEITA